jgi:hypothetical protein
MKIAQHFRAYLDAHQSLQLPLLGRFNIVGHAGELFENGVPKKWIQFIANKDEAAEPCFIQYMSQAMKVETCIAESDLNCFCQTTREMLIQGFEAEIPGIGFLHFETGDRLQFSLKSIYKNAMQKLPKRSPAFISSFWL